MTSGVFEKGMYYGTGRHTVDSGRAERRHGKQMGRGGRHLSCRDYPGALRTGGRYHEKVTGDIK